MFGRQSAGECLVDKHFVDKHFVDGNSLHGYSASGRLRNGLQSLDNGLLLGDQLFQAIGQPVQLLLLGLAVNLLSSILDLLSGAVQRFGRLLCGLRGGLHTLFFRRLLRGALLLCSVTYGSGRLAIALGIHLFRLTLGRLVQAGLLIGQFGKLFAGLGLVALLRPVRIGILPAAIAARPLGAVRWPAALNRSLPNWTPPVAACAAHRPTIGRLPLASWRQPQTAPFRFALLPTA